MGAQENSLIKIIVDRHALDCKECSSCQTACPTLFAKLQEGKDDSIVVPGSDCGDCMDCIANCSKGKIMAEFSIVYAGAGEPEGNSFTPMDNSQLNTMLQNHRGVCQFNGLDVEQGKIRNIIETLWNTPVALPTAEIKALVLHTPQVISHFIGKLLKADKRHYNLLSKYTYKFLKKYGGSATDELLYGNNKWLYDKCFEELVGSRKYKAYGAPLAFYFYTGHSINHAASVDSAAITMLVAESLGLKTCMIGGLHRSAHSIRLNNSVKVNSSGILVLCGYADGGSKELPHGRKRKND